MRREKIHFVYEHLENISSEALEKYQDVIRTYVRRRQGVYALYRAGKLYYVGLASNLRTRLKAHLKDRHKKLWDRFSVYLTVNDAHLRELEALVLRIAAPGGNRQKGKFVHSEDLRRRFARDIRQRQTFEFRDLLGRTAKALEAEPESESDVRKPVLFSYVNGRPMKLRGHVRGKFVTARVRRDGQIRFGGQLFHSPSLAAAAACNRKSKNGWTFWEYERTKGDWIVLDELRR